MAIFVLHCLDYPGALDVRLANRAAHLDHARSLGGQLKLAGPYIDEAGSPIGSLIIIDVADRLAAETFAANDPYAKAGLFQSVEIKPFRHVLPEG
jgi:uncharacterized protein